MGCYARSLRGRNHPDAMPFACPAHMWVLKPSRDLLAINAYVVTFKKIAHGVQLFCRWTVAFCHSAMLLAWCLSSHYWHEYIAAAHLVLKDVLCEQSASSDANVAARPGLELGSRSPLWCMALDGVHAVLLALALAVRPVLPVHRQGVRVVYDQRRLYAYTRIFAWGQSAMYAYRLYSKLTLGLLVMQVACTIWSWMLLAILG